MYQSSDHSGIAARVFLACLLALALTGAGAAVSATGREHDASGGAGIEDHDTAGNGHDEEHGEGELRLPAAERERLGIDTGQVAVRTLEGIVEAPGEVLADRYRSSVITPRIRAQVVARHVRLGDRVKTGQPLVTLSSVEMANAQGELIEADREWRRVRRLGREVVSAQRYVAAQVARQRAWATVLAYGMTKAELEPLIARGDVSRATGQFSLLAPQDGTVVSDEFTLGEFVEPGRALIEITDESKRWVEAAVAPDEARRMPDSGQARVCTRDGTCVDAHVVGRHHRIDETTRTLALRLAIDNPDDAFHPGEYVRVLLALPGSAPSPAVPEEAVVLFSGMPTVFRVDGQRIEPVTVETGPTRGGWTAIKAGLAAGDTVVTRGAFVVKSLLMKSELGEGHAH